MTSDPLLNNEERFYLLQLARSTIASRARGKEFKPKWSSSRILKTHLGVFVTLNKNYELRGCIGYVEGIMELQKAVREMAEAAAFDDPRFPPVSGAEVNELEIEISVLSPLQQVKDISEIEVGKHGIIVEKDFYKGLLLPQVATEYKWDRDTFLEHTCVKAGLPADAWLDDSAIIKIFSAEIFSEKDISH